MRYTVWLKDEKRGAEYSMLTTQQGINELSEWINTYINRWSLKLIKVEAGLEKVEFLHSELSEQIFICNLEERLLAYYEQEKEGVPLYA